MNWHRVSDYCIRSDCHTYTVCKVWQAGIASYELWHAKQRLSTHKTADEAKAAVVGKAA